MLSHSRCLLRKRTAWRELLHPLPPRHRKMQWLRRDVVELNEGVLRKPYYTLRPTCGVEGMRESLVFTSIGPSLHETPYSSGSPLPRYPSSWNTVIQHSDNSE